MGAINDFQGQMKKANGFARLARYEVVLTAPDKLVKSLAKEGFNLVDYSRGLSMMCDSITMPGKDLKTGPVKHGQELQREQVQAHVFEGTITATFYLENNLAAKSFFEVWQDQAVSNGSNNVNYYDDYIGTMKIYQLGVEQIMETQKSPFDGDHYTGKKEYFMEGPRNSYISQTTRDNTREVHQSIPVRTYGIEVEEVFPATVGQIDYAYATANELARISVEFQYKNWKTMHPEKLF
jgi:hypothetical protein